MASKILHFITTLTIRIRIGNKVKSVKRSLRSYLVHYFQNVVDKQNH